MFVGLWAKRKLFVGLRLAFENSELQCLFLSKLLSSTSSGPFNWREFKLDIEHIVWAATIKSCWREYKILCEKLCFILAFCPIFSDYF